MIKRRGDFWKSEGQVFDSACNNISMVNRVLCHLNSVNHGVGSSDHFDE